MSPEILDRIEAIRAIRVELKRTGLDYKSAQKYAAFGIQYPTRELWSAVQTLKQLPPTAGR